MSWVKENRAYYLQPRSATVLFNSNVFYSSEASFLMPLSVLRETAVPQQHHILFRLWCTSRDSLRCESEPERACSGALRNAAEDRWSGIHDIALKYLVTVSDRIFWQILYFFMVCIQLQNSFSQRKKAWTENIWYLAVTLIIAIGIASKKRLMGRTGRLEGLRNEPALGIVI